MLSTNNQDFRRRFVGRFFYQSAFALFCLLAAAAFGGLNAPAQGPVNGGFEGKVLDTDGKAIANISVVFVNAANGYQTARKTDQNGYFRQDTLSPGVYRITVEVPGYKPREVRQVLYATRSNETVPVPIILEKESAAVAQNPAASLAPSPVSAGNQNDEVASDINEGASLNPRRDEAFNEFRVRTLSLGGTTLTRTFDELAFLAAGVAPPPQAIGNTVGPGVGGGVGTSGQFSVNGLRSRANNFTVDGSDNNDEDIGVRRQGFFSLVPQPIESIQEFQIITLLAPAQYGRNLGAQVNAISKSGGNDFHGTLFGFFNSDQFNSRNFFDGAGGDTTTALQGRRFNNLVPVFVNGQAKQVTNSAGQKDSFTLLQGGFAVGGRIVRDKAFFFVSGEGQLLNAVQERHYAVPTVEERGFVGSATTGLQQCLNPVSGAVGTVVSGVCRVNGVATNFTPGFPTSLGGDAVFSLFPFANDPSGIYGRNTYTQALSADARGLILSGKFDYNFSLRGKPQTFVARYNFTDDRRDLPEVGGAIFSSIRPLVQTNNFSTFISGGLTDKISNELRFSWGRTDLEFEELRDTTGFIVPVRRNFSNAGDARFLLNARQLFNNTLPVSCSPTGCAAPFQPRYDTFRTTEDSELGLIGQMIVAGFSPIGVDVFNFPQERKNDTFQIADNLRWQVGEHSLTLGADLRRTFLDSDLPRNSRPLVTFNGAVTSRLTNGQPNGQLAISSPLDLASVGAATGFFQSLVLPGNDSRIALSYNQLNFFAQDDWRLARNFSLNYGLRYEYNTVPKESDRKIESTFQTAKSLFPFLAPSGSFAGIDTFQGFQRFLDGRTKIYDSDRNNFTPRIGFAWSPSPDTIIRGGYGTYYDQILGAVISQSRNVFPTFSTLNTGGGDLACNGRNFQLLNPLTGTYSTRDNCSGALPLVAPGTLNTLNPRFNRIELLNSLLAFFPRVNGTFFGATIPKRKLASPLSHQYSLGIEQEIFQGTFLSAAYVGTTGRQLLRFATPNLGNNYLVQIDNFNIDINSNQPTAFGTTFDAYSNSNLTRPNRNVGPINQFETTGRSRYDSLQVGLRGRLSRSLQYQLNYTFGSVRDNVSDVFDLAGASALPQNSITEAGEYAPANFDVRHRFTYNFVYNAPKLNGRNDYLKGLLGGWQIAGTGKFNTGQPFTVNSIFDINHDGNLTDRLNSTQFITETKDRRQPLSLSSNANLQAMLAAFGQDGAVPRNSFRAGSVLELDLSFVKRFDLTENRNLQFRVDVFNFINRANFGIPVRFLESPGFGQATDTITPGRRFQLAVKYNF